MSYFYANILAYYFMFVNVLFNVKSKKKVNHLQIFRRNNFTAQRIAYKEKRYCLCENLFSCL
jgi:hypothetical protein